jgi:sarcosine oxidase, subunit beta
MRTLAGPGLRKGGMRGLARIAQMTCISLRIRWRSDGPWAQRVGDILGAPVKLIPQRHEICVVSLDSDLPYLMPFVLEPEWPNDPFRRYVRHEGPRLLLVGLHTDQLDALPMEDPDAYIRTPDEEYVERVGERLLARFPRLPNPAFVRGWAGLYPLSVDG